MSKPFFEVFPTLKVKDDIQMMFQGVEVTKVSTNSTRDFIRVSIYSRHLIQKKDIYEVAYAEAAVICQKPYPGDSAGAV